MIPNTEALLRSLYFGTLGPQDSSTNCEALQKALAHRLDPLMGRPVSAPWACDFWLAGPAATAGQERGHDAKLRSVGLL